MPPEPLFDMMRINALKGVFMTSRENAQTPDANQYATPKNLNARIKVHALYSTNKQGWMRWVFDEIARAKGPRVLELGCGNGGLWRDNLARVPTGWEISLTDNSEGMLKEAAANLACADHEFHFTAANAEKIPFADASYDIVIANHMLYCLEDLSKGLREIRRVLAPGGTFFASTIGENHMRELRDIVSPLAPNAPFVRQNETNSFSLENGRQQLLTHFADVRLALYKDALEVPAVEPLLEWLMSTKKADKMLSAKLPAIRSVLSEILAARGRIRVTKSSGMFVAS
jgi:ubiquinone/menaquinone biosynthesis C-methylase UbiE